MIRWLPWLSLVLAVAILAGVAIFGTQHADDFATPQPSPELRKFFERCERVRLEMPEAEVDRIFVDDSNGPTEKVDGEGADPSMPRFRKWYYSVADSSDGKYAIGIDFCGGRVVSKRMGYVE